MTRKLLLTVVLFVLILVSCCLIFAESTDCANPVLIIPDGRLTQSSITQNATYWYGIYAVAGHSYSVEFEPPADNYAGASHVIFSQPTVFGPNDIVSGSRGGRTVAATTNSGTTRGGLHN